jgi:hypothetical protein
MNITYCSCITAVTEWGSTECIPYRAFYNCTSLALTELPSGITSIENRAFQGCSALALTELPSSITSIGNYAFYSCKNISIQAFPEGLLSIGDSAFFMDYPRPTDKIYGLTIILPSTLQNIGGGCFVTMEETADGVRCGYLAGVKILATTPPALTVSSYENENHAVFSAAGDFEETFKITVPAGCGEAYRAAEGWSEYADYIVEAS